jgi:EmrB/QacA subfamily drug resistance transporter
MKYKWVVLTVTTIGIFMASLDGSIIVVGLPTVLQDLNATLVHGVWIITIYRLMITVLLVSLGRVADMFGRVRLYNLGFVIFTIGSALCTLSQNGEQLIAFRLVQGLGAALLFVNSAAIVTDAFPHGELGMGMGVNMIAINAGNMVGYTVSGVMIGLFGWRSLFLINIPIGIFGTFWSYRSLREIHKEQRHEKFDYLGSALYSIALLMILVAITVGSPSSSTNLLLLSMGVVLFPIFVIIEQKQRYPALDLKLFKIKLFTAGNVSSLLNAISFISLPFILTLYFQLVKLYDPFTSGLLLIPMEVAVILIGPISGKLSDKYGARGLSSIGLALNSFSLIWLSTLDEKSPYTMIAAVLCLAGVGTGLFRSPNASSIMGSVPPERRGVANGVRATILNTGMLLSIPLSLTLMTLGMPYERLSELTSGAQLVSTGELATFMRAIRYALLSLGVINATAIIPSLLRGPKINRSEYLIKS